ncbi:BspA family leucine-rich repeat surface protein [Helicobacter ailurogastricus]|uniref:BspA family leucine-rich repeat surface protein n=2 Tax=Helicobacter ailurogastricus TaxID=1578720 RepID=UPI00248F66D3|nr:BspA family leucine-rich repeat surface protein [Helicobacter ailurogastricus]
MSSRSAFICLLFLVGFFPLRAQIFVPKDKTTLQNLLQNPHIPLTQINTHYIKDMSYLFCLQGPLAKKGICTPYREDFKGIGKWDVSHVENMEGMFMNQMRFNEPLRSWNTSRVKNFSYMFANATSFNQPINNWNTSRGVDFSYMFANATSFNQPINNWNTSRGVDFSYMFYHARAFNQPLSRWNGKHIATPKNFSYMFANATHFRQDISQWKNLEQANTQGIFLGSPLEGTKIQSQKTRKTLHTQAQREMQGMSPPNVLRYLHYPQTKAELTALINDPKIPLASIDTSLIEDMSYLFCDKNNTYARLKQLPIKNGSLWAKQDKEYSQLLNLFENCHTSSTRTDLNGIETWNVSHVKSMEAMFMGREVNVSLNSWDTSGVTNMKGMFALASFNQPLDDWEMQHVQDTSFMFYGCKDFNQNLNHWNVEYVRNMSYMFSLTYSFNGDITHWKLSNATNLQGMFKYATAFNRPIQGWDVSHVENMSYLFYGAFAFNQPLNEWDTSHVTDMHKMFFFAKSFNQPLDDWDTTRVRNMYQMFAYAKSFNQDLSGWRLYNANTRCMFFQAIKMRSPSPKTFFKSIGSCG